MDAKRWLLLLALPLTACQTDNRFVDSFGSIMNVSPATITATAAVGGTPATLSVTVANVGRGAMPWRARIIGGQSWLSIQPDSGIAGAVLQVRLDPTALAVGNYRDSVAVTDLASGGTAVVRVMLTVHP